MSRSACGVVAGPVWAWTAPADAPPGLTGGTASLATVKGLAPGGRGPARPRGEAAPTTLPAKGKPAVLPVFPPYSGGPNLASQPPLEIALFGKKRPIHMR